MKKLRLSLLAVILALFASACGGGSGGTPPAEGTNAGAKAAEAGGAQRPANASDAQEPAAGDAEEADAAAEGFPLTVTDASGAEITFERPPERIVSITPSETEVLFAVGAGPRVAGTDDWSDYPPEAAELPKVGGFEMNVEAILELDPDLVVGSWSMSAAIIEELRRHGITVYASDPKTIDDVIEHLRTIGAITGAKRAEEAAARMEEERRIVLEAVGDLADSEKRTVYAEFSEGWTVGKGEYVDELITLAGGVNVVQEEGWFEINEEAIIEADPQVILYSANVPGLKDTIMGRSGWDKIDAIANGRVFAVNDALYVRPGPRLTQGLLEIAKAIHPERFAE